ncbi:Cytochrome b5-like heme/steroid binding domain [Trypanosoma melophagium]|uniref:Cytochrome b5-like heme/steroid binding domain n=1 Tax=Trypanosoma melophagium TaxID=715481 RepID=UPI00351AA4BC|nr:Cytochrome b5-like heme/steroid binding domain [Trypanosoma melophagium]
MSKVFSLTEVARHNKEEDLWLIINKKVYDVTKFVDAHPGGVDTLTATAGRDGTDDFNSVGHSDSAKEELNKYYIGELDPNDVAALKPPVHGTKSSFSCFAIVIVLIAIVIYLIFSP